MQRWNEGCHNGMQLWREIQAQGYTSSRASVTRFVQLIVSPHSRRICLGGVEMT